MRLLVDTQCFLWMQAAPDRFGPASLELLRNADTEVLLSAASAWEIAIKYALGKLPLPERPQVYVPSRMQTSGTTGLAVVHAHALRVAALPMHHRDPFDRLIVAQAQLEGVPVLTSDHAFDGYDVEVLRP